jgi:hypothetical protein
MDSRGRKKGFLRESAPCLIGIGLGLVLVFAGVIPLPFRDAIPLELASRPRVIKGMLLIGSGVYLIIGCLMWMRGKSRINRQLKPLKQKWK